MARSAAETRKRRRLRRRFLLVIIVIGAALAGRALGFGAVVVRTEAMGSHVQPGDYLIAIPKFRAFTTGSTVLTWWGGERPPLQKRVRRVWGMLSEPADKGDTPIPETPIVRLVIANGGDRVTVHRDLIVVRDQDDGSLQQYAMTPWFPLDSPDDIRLRVVPEGQVFVIALEPGFLDSRHWGPVDLDAIIAETPIRVLPLRRFGPLEASFPGPVDPGSVNLDPVNPGPPTSVE